jgi:hypothetical protein
MDSHSSVQKMVQDEQFPFQFEKWIEISDGKRFPIVVNMGNGLYYLCIIDNDFTLWLTWGVV